MEQMCIIGVARHMLTTTRSCSQQKKRPAKTFSAQRGKNKNGAWRLYSLLFATGSGELLSESCSEGVGKTRPDLGASVENTWEICA